MSFFIPCPLALIYDEHGVHDPLCFRLQDEFVMTDSGLVQIAAGREGEKSIACKAVIETGFQLPVEISSEFVFQASFNSTVSKRKVEQRLPE